MQRYEMFLKCRRSYPRYIINTNMSRSRIVYIIDIENIRINIDKMLFFCPRITRINTK
jgi:hypothetical protein